MDLFMCWAAAVVAVLGIVLFVLGLLAHHEGMSAAGGVVFLVSCAVFIISQGRHAAQQAAVRAASRKATQDLWASIPTEMRSLKFAEKIGDSFLANDGEIYQVSQSVKEDYHTQMDTRERNALRAKVILSIGKNIEVEVRVWQATNYILNVKEN